MNLVTLTMAPFQQIMKRKAEINNGYLLHPCFTRVNVCCEKDQFIPSLQIADCMYGSSFETCVKTMFVAYTRFVMEYFHALVMKCWILLLLDNTVCYAFFYLHSLLQVLLNRLQELWERKLQCPTVQVHVSALCWIRFLMNKYLVKDVFPYSLTIHFVFTDETGCSCKWTWKKKESLKTFHHGQNYSKQNKPRSIY